MSGKLPHASDVVTLAEAYALSQCVTLSTLSNRVFGEGKKLRLLVNGTDLSLTRYRSTLQWFSDRWPEGLEWPAEIIRPEAGGVA